MIKYQSTKVELLPKTESSIKQRNELKKAIQGIETEINKDPVFVSIRKIDAAFNKNIKDYLNVKLN